MIRLPDFVTKADFDWAVDEATKKKKTDFSKVEYIAYDAIFSSSTGISTAPMKFQ